MFWDTEVGLSGWGTAVGLLQSMAWQCVLEYYWHRLVGTWKGVWACAKNPLERVPGGYMSCHPIEVGSFENSSS